MFLAKKVLPLLPQLLELYLKQMNGMYNSDLDIILKSYVEDDLDYHEIMKLGFDDEIVRHVINLVDNSEYKRRQSPPGIKITPKNFGRDRRLPIVNKYREF